MRREARKLAAASLAEAEDEDAVAMGDDKLVDDDGDEAAAEEEEEEEEDPRADSRGRAHPQVVRQYRVLEV